MERIITIKGTGNIKKKPDLIEIDFYFSARKNIYDEAIIEVDKDFKEVSDALAKIGFDKSDLKTTSFDVSTKYKWVKDEKKNETKVFDGYECERNAKFTFDFDNEKLKEVLNVISCLEAKPKFDIDFTLKNPNDVSNELLEAAVKNAIEKANTIAKASNVKLGKVLEIIYNWGEINIHSESRYNSDIYCCEKVSADFEPDDINLNDTVTIIWEIV